MHNGSVFYVHFERNRDKGTLRIISCFIIHFLSYNSDFSAFKIIQTKWSLPRLFFWSKYNSSIVNIIGCFWYPRLRNSEFSCFFCKVKGFVINAVAWNNHESTEVKSRRCFCGQWLWNLLKISTKKILLGTTKGQIFETVIEAVLKPFLLSSMISAIYSIYSEFQEKDKSCKRLYELASEVDSRPLQICGLQLYSYIERV